MPSSSSSLAPAATAASSSPPPASTKPSSSTPSSPSQPHLHDPIHLIIQWEATFDELDGNNNNSNSFISLLNSNAAYQEDLAKFYHQRGYHHDALKAYLQALRIREGDNQKEKKAEGEENDVDVRCRIEMMRTIGGLAYEYLKNYDLGREMYEGVYNECRRQLGLVESIAAFRFSSSLEEGQKEEVLYYERQMYGAMNALSKIAQDTNDNALSNQLLNQIFSALFTQAEEWESADPQQLAQDPEAFERMSMYAKTCLQIREMEEAFKTFQQLFELRRIAFATSPSSHLLLTQLMDAAKLSVEVLEQFPRSSCQGEEGEQTEAVGKEEEGEKAERRLHVWQVLSHCVEDLKKIEDGGENKGEVRKMMVWIESKVYKYGMEKDGSSKEWGLALRIVSALLDMQRQQHDHLAIAKTLMILAGLYEVKEKYKKASELVEETLEKHLYVVLSSSSLTSSLSLLASSSLSSSSSSSSSSSPTAPVAAAASTTTTQVNVDQVKDHIIIALERLADLSMHQEGHFALAVAYATKALQLRKDCLASTSTAQESQEGQSKKVDESPDLAVAMIRLAVLMTNAAEASYRATAGLDLDGESNRIGKCKEALEMALQARGILEKEGQKKVSSSTQQGEDELIICEDFIEKARRLIRMMGEKDGRLALQQTKKGFEGGGSGEVGAGGKGSRKKKGRRWVRGRQ